MRDNLTIHSLDVGLRVLVLACRSHRLVEDLLRGHGQYIGVQVSAPPIAKYPDGRFVLSQGSGGCSKGVDLCRSYLSLSS